ncbi:hypothetical protein [uncultured Rubinisphaera sp.]|uniref:hypothetical protein n=2 Tax=Rubinisphaera TaxID=1649490 RepID=UPI0030D96D19
MFTEQTGDREKRPTILIHDRDTKYTKKFRETVESAGMKTNPLPIASPNLNGRCERFIETIKLESLNQFIVLGKKHLDYLTDKFTQYHNTKRSWID